jgi:hypothetical protein
MYSLLQRHSSTYDHRYQNTRDPVRSPLDKLVIVRLVLGWVTTGESLMLYVFFWLFSRYNLFDVLPVPV